jgi:hypothetical protein
MWSQFFLENVHFAINLLAFLVFFATAWLYFDAWLGRKTFRNSLRWLGFLLLSVSFLISSVYLETTVLKDSVLGSNLNLVLLACTRIPGYLLIIYSLISDPLQPKPELNGKTGLALVAPKAVSFSVIASLSFLYPILAAIAGFLYLRRATVGLENHLKTVAFGFFVLSISELLSLARVFQNTANVDLYNLVAPFGILWMLATLLTFVAVFLMRGWVFSYLLERLQSQLFMIFTAMVVIIFLLSTVSFTSLLLKNLQDETMSRLETDVKVLNFAIDSKKAESLSDSQVLAQNPDVVTLLVDEKPSLKLNDIVQNYLLTKKQSFLVITSNTGQVLARGEDSERVGDSLSNDPLIKRALLGQSASSVITKDGVLAPQISISSAVPITKGGTILGAVMTGTVVDNAFADGVKNATGLEASLYADNVLSATTLSAAGGKTRAVGIKEENSAVKTNVLLKGKSYVGALSLLNVSYFAAYLPLKDVDNVPVGMLSVAKPQIGVLEAAGRSIEMTFVVSVILLIISIFPALLIARYLAKQLE